MPENGLTAHPGTDWHLRQRSILAPILLANSIAW
jgi:hypothetical protein